MTSDTRIPPAEVTGAYGAIVKFAARKMIGQACPTPSACCGTTRR